MNCLPTPWKDNFSCFSLDDHVHERTCRYTKIVAPSLLAMVFNVVWTKLHRKVVAIAKNCPKCSPAGKKLKPVLRQKQVERLPSCADNKQEIAIDFAGPLQDAIYAGNFLLAAVDLFSGWLEAKFKQYQLLRTSSTSWKNIHIDMGCQKQ